jgi:glycosyltransferase involved in cell wall biosynthesis
MENIRVALVHDWLTGRRGGEKVLEVLAEIFPQAPIYTLIHFPGSQTPEIEKRLIKTSFLQRMPFLKKHYRSYLPLFPLAAELFDLQEYELVISSSHCVVKGVIPRPDALHISYIHAPIRYAWDQYFAYFSPRKLPVFSRILIPPVLHYLRLWDESSSTRVDHFLANSVNVARRIRKYYRREAEVIPPPVDTEFFRPADGGAEDYYLIVSALVPYKMIDLAIAAFNRFVGRLKIVGQGPDEKKLRRQAGANTEFLGAVDPPSLLRLCQNARALILPGEEDFGITALEAEACGTPVIALGRGGALETVIAEKTGLFFPEPKVESLLAALDKFQGLEFNKPEVRSHAMKFSRDIFKEKVQACIRQQWLEFKEAK